MPYSPKYPQYDSDEVVERFIMRYTQHQWTLREIAAKYGVGVSGIYRALLKAGVKLRSPQSRRTPDRRCLVCSEHKMLDEFPKDATKCKGYSYLCKVCTQDRNEALRKED